MFWGGRTNIHNDESEEWRSTMLDETVQCVHTLLRQSSSHFSDMWQEMVVCFSHEASEATMVCALQELEIWKVCVHWVLWQLTEECQNNCMGMALNFLIQYKEDGIDLLEQIITTDKSWIYFYKPERKSANMVWKKRWRRAEKIQGWVVYWASDVNDFLHWIWLWCL